MKKEDKNKEDTEQKPSILQEECVAYNTTADSIDTFEEDWENAISGDELVKRVHEHIDKWYASK